MAGHDSRAADGAPPRAGPLAQAGRHWQNPGSVVRVSAPAPVSGTGIPIPVERLIDWVRDARARTLELVGDLTDAQLIGPRLPTVNPLLWEIGHAAYFQEQWVLRHAAKHRPIRVDADRLWDSIGIAHETRWDLPLPSRADTVRYLTDVRDRVCDFLASGKADGRAQFLAMYAVFHEDMHDEAFTYTRQTLGYPAPRIFRPGNPIAGPRGPVLAPPRLPPIGGDVEIPAGTARIGAPPDAPFAFDNEKWAHEVVLRPYRIARTPVTQAEFAAFVEAGGYARRAWWSDEGWAWREAERATAPVYWARDQDGGWLRRDFERWVPLEPRRPMLHVSWHEAEAYCRFAKRRLPTEAEWEHAAGATRGAGPAGPYPWGTDVPTSLTANLDWGSMGCVDVDACPDGDSAWGCRQMLGNVWEWTADTFQPYPGFVPDHYQEYSQPLFGSTKVLRGGCWVTRHRLLRNTWRNYYTPDRQDVWAGFRTCALD